MTTLLRSERFPAILLLASAALGLIVANTPIGPAALGVKNAEFDLWGLHATTGHLISDGLLVVFFFTVAVELQFELTNGQLNSFRRALQPAIGAAGGVIVPIVIYLAIAGGDETRTGWPIPTATDIAFALGVLAVFGKGLPSPVRVFLLALAILDDIVGIVFIAVLFAHDVDLVLFLLAIVVIVVFGILSRMLDSKARKALIVAMIVLAVVAWLLVYQSGVHATIAGVLLGLAVKQHPGMMARHHLEPWVNGAILPLFAFSAALVAIPSVSFGELSPALWAILIALPVGKIIGITGFGWLAMRIRPRGTAPTVMLGDLVAAGALGGIGFTVSLLLSELAFAGNSELGDEAVLGVLAGSMVALVLSAVIVSLRARSHRKAGTAT